MENDPFLAAGIDIPEELPYQDQTCLNPEQSGLISRAASLVKEVSEKMTPKESPKILHKSDNNCKNEIIEIDSIAQNTFDTMIATASDRQSKVLLE